MLFNAGDHVPGMPLIEVVGNGDKKAPEQIGAIGAKSTMAFGFTVIVNVAVLAHCPTVGVKV